MLIPTAFLAAVSEVDTILNLSKTFRSDLDHHGSVCAGP